MRNRWLILLAVVALYTWIAHVAPVAGALDERVNDKSWTAFAVEAEARFGDFGKRAAAFLAEHRPSRDAAIDSELLIENLAFAVKARERFEWAADIDEAMFFNDVLPYAVIDEPRDRWRPEMFELASDIVADAEDIVDAVQALNRELFRRTNVRYSTQRERPNQNPSESRELGKASCTGLSIMLISACRAVGIPARIAGIASWVNRGGNHAWVEIWDGRQWRFTGAAEYDREGLDRTWFTDAASRAIEGHERFGVWATSWRATGHHYPLVWNMDDRTVPAVEVTHRYRRADQETSPDDPDEPVTAVRLWRSRGEARLRGRVRLMNEEGEAVAEAQTYADPDDVNRVGQLPFLADTEMRLEVVARGETRIAWIPPRETPDNVIELYWDELSLSKESAKVSIENQWDKRAAEIRTAAMDELEHAKVIRDGDDELRLKWKQFDTEERRNDPHARLSLWVSLHGGGGAPTEVNDQQWRNQLTLYEPETGFYVAPRAPSDTWNMWHRAETDRLLGRLIETAIAIWEVDPDRVYLLGYSAGGDGVYQLAPRMADRFAAASMMAGHPNDATPHGLRNLPFAIFMGGKDEPFNRNKVAAQWGEQLAELQRDDPDGYVHRVTIYPELGHWMEGRDAEALPWMASFTRDPWPPRIVWRQGNVLHQRFYWLAADEPEDANRGHHITAEVDEQSIALRSDDLRRITLLLHDRLVDLDEPITVKANGQTVFEGRVPRTTAAIRRSLEDRADPSMAATAELTVEW